MFLPFKCCFHFPFLLLLFSLASTLNPLYIAFMALYMNKEEVLSQGFLLEIPVSKKKKNQGISKRLVVLQ